ncbi:SURF1 family protein [Sphingomonas sp. ASV193]|uniref:SURF1 family protein n=1 Tax=Sphingomonas sp. ASV193 TaxID=3144405 RepID=UPI0032E893C1
MRRVPPLATALVALAVAAMIGLGFWQLGRLREKEAQLALYAAAPGKPPVTVPVIGDAAPLLFRRATGMCLKPAAIEREGAGAQGFRLIAHCVTGAEGPGLLVQIGTTRDPEAKVAWNGGPVAGTLAPAPDHRALIESLFSPRRATVPMLVLSPPAAGLSPNAAPDLSVIPNNHFAYAVQWFAFAAIAAIIYALALRKRWRERR